MRIVTEGTGRRCETGALIFGSSVLQSSCCLESVQTNPCPQCGLPPLICPHRPYGGQGGERLDM